MSTLALTIAGDTIAAVSLTGVTVAATGASVTISPTPPVAFALSGGEWTVTITGLTAGVLYDCAVSLTYGDATTGATSVRHLEPGGTHYGSVAGMRAIGGAINEQVYADLNNDQNAATIAANEESALTFADAVIDMSLSPVFVTPLSFTDNASRVIVADIANKIALMQLYKGRGAQDAKGDALANAWKADIDSTLADWYMRPRWLGAALDAGSPAPGVAGVSLSTGRQQSSYGGAAYPACPWGAWWGW